MRCQYYASRITPTYVTMNCNKSKVLPFPLKAAWFTSPPKLKALVLNCALFFGPTSMTPPYCLFNLQYATFPEPHTSLTQCSTRVLIHALITPHTNYCVAFLTSIPNEEPSPTLNQWTLHSSLNYKILQLTTITCLPHTCPNKMYYFIITSGLMLKKG